MTRAVVDASLRLTSLETVFALLSCTVNAGRTGVEDVKAELDTSSMRGSRALRLAVTEAETGTRSWPEAQARALFQRAGFPPPLVNVPLVLGGRVFVPDFRWGMVVVEIGSRAHHLLEPGAWERTQERRAALSSLGFLVLPCTPQQLRDTPELVIAAVRSGLQRAVTS